MRCRVPFTSSRRKPSSARQRESSTLDAALGRGAHGCNASAPSSWPSRFLWVLPIGAEAKPGYKVLPGGIELILPFGQEDGSIVSVSATGRQRVQLASEGNISRIEYSTTGQVSSRRVEADFGDLGRVHVRVDLGDFSSDPRRAGRCTGRGPVYGEGSYHGTIELSHQEGVPEVSVERGRVYFERRFRQVCKRRRAPSKPGLFSGLKRKIEEAVLSVRGRGEGRTVSLEATIYAFKLNPAHSSGTLSTAVYERREGVRIARSTGLPFGDWFVMSRRGKTPESIEIGTAKPYSGRAFYSRSPGSSPSWSGDLSVDLPGTHAIPLAGPGFTAVLCRGKVDHCRAKAVP